MKISGRCPNLLSAIGVIVLTAICPLGSTVVFAQGGKNTPKLILQITVDQLRGDLPKRYYERLGEGGFKYLWESGVVYRDAHHAHANTETIVGHATLATGAHPSNHGMVGNLWFDRESGRVTYNVEDSNYRLLTQGAGVDDNAEIDPTQRAANTEGRSPAAILVTTFADELRSSNGGQSRAIGISVKDRAATAMAGHAGTAFWFSKASGGFVTSNYYLDHYPRWVEDWNGKQLSQRYANTSWNLLHTPDSYLFGATDDREWETDVAGFGRVFPHPYGDGESPYFTTLLTLSPAGDNLVLDFARTALIGEKLGRGDTYVPIVFAGAGLAAKTVDRRVNTIDIAPTLSAYLGIKPPSGSQGILLKEVLEQ